MNTQANRSISRKVEGVAVINGGVKYVLVKARLDAFWLAFPSARIICERVEDDIMLQQKRVMFRCTILDENMKIMVQAHKTGSMTVQDAYEKCETGAIGRAIATLGFDSDEDSVHAQIELAMLKDRGEVPREIGVTGNGAVVPIKDEPAQEPKVESVHSPLAPAPLDRGPIVPGTPRTLPVQPSAPADATLPPAPAEPPVESAPEKSEFEKGIAKAAMKKFAMDCADREKSGFKFVPRTGRKDVDGGIQLYSTIADFTEVACAILDFCEDPFADDNPERVTGNAIFWENARKAMAGLVTDDEPGGESIREAMAQYAESKKLLTEKGGD